MDIVERLKADPLTDPKVTAQNIVDAVREIESLRAQFLDGVSAILAKVKENNAIVKDAEARLDRAGL